MSKNDPMDEILSAYLPRSPIPLSDAWTKSIEELTGYSTLSETLKQSKQPLASQSFMDSLLRSKERNKPTPAPKNPKYAINERNFAKLVDGYEEIKSSLNSNSNQNASEEDSQIEKEKTQKNGHKNQVAFLSGMVVMAIIFFYILVKTR